MHEMRPELAVDAGDVGTRALVWHIAAAKDSRMLCGLDVAAAPDVLPQEEFEVFTERQCAPCLRAYRLVLAEVR
ncbi:MULTISPECIES: hypothetical protein [Streptacidiphilus]|uniref:Uncharacterized protein n=1 Tax=Streptacidiphilus cavernicola TaxID=3342716 RepID=A0ABV6UP56_9ACTN|nr:hypothetical protein [Streptacidiphilus jeojiense]